MSTLFLVENPAGERLVTAKKKQTAINHVIRPGVTARALTAIELAPYLAKGLTIETADETKPEADKETDDGQA